MKKRILALALASVMVFALTACGNSDSNNAADPTSAPAATEAAGSADVV